MARSGRMEFSNHSMIFAKSSLRGLSTTSWLRVQRNSPRRAVDKMNCPGVEVSFFNLIFCNICPFFLANKQTNIHPAQEISEIQNHSQLYHPEKNPVYFIPVSKTAKIGEYIHSYTYHFHDWGFYHLDTLTACVCPEPWIMTSS